MSDPCGPYYHTTCRSGFYHLRQLRSLCQSLPAEATKTLVQAFISCCLDLTATLCCTEWPTNSCGKYSWRIMLRQGWSQEPNVLNTSHRYCVNFIGCRSDDELNSKIASLVYQVLSSKVPTCLADDIYLASESFARSLRSSLRRKCSVTRVHSRFGDRCFAAAGPRIWNNLPASLWDKEVSYTEFRRQLKTIHHAGGSCTNW